MPTSAASCFWFKPRASRARRILAPSSRQNVAVDSAVIVGLIVTIRFEITVEQRRISVALAIVAPPAGVKDQAVAVGARQRADLVERHLQPRDLAAQQLRTPA